jgi:hypothetical protein
MSLRPLIEEQTGCSRKLHLLCASHALAIKSIERNVSSPIGPWFEPVSIAAPSVGGAST